MCTTGCCEQEPCRTRQYQGGVGACMYLYVVTDKHHLKKPTASRGRTDAAVRKPRSCQPHTPHCAQHIPCSPEESTQQCASTWCKESSCSTQLPQTHTACIAQVTKPRHQPRCIKPQPLAHAPPTTHAGAGALLKHHTARQQQQLPNPTTCKKQGSPQTISAPPHSTTHMCQQGPMRASRIHPTSCLSRQLSIPPVCLCPVGCGRIPQQRQCCEQADARCSHQQHSWRHELVAQHCRECGHYGGAQATQPRHRPAAAAAASKQ